jgi:predicted lysophospholipase L1 biosynthesis ABC-type transport system permease subunit
MAVERAIPMDIIVIVAVIALVVVVGAMIIAIAKSEKIIAVVAEIVVMAIMFCHLQFLPVTQINPAPLDGSRGKNMAASRIRWFRLGSFAGCSEGAATWIAGARPA